MDSDTSVAFLKRQSSVSSRSFMRDVVYSPSRAMLRCTRAVVLSRASAWVSRAVTGSEGALFLSRLETAVFSKDATLYIVSKLSTSSSFSSSSSASTCLSGSALESSSLSPLDVCSSSRRDNESRYLE